jgi:hypothetical protein
MNVFGFKIGTLTQTGGNDGIATGGISTHERRTNAPVRAGH